MKKRITVLLCVLTIFLLGCGTKAPTLVGTWTPEDGASASFEFYSDGTGLEKESMGTFPLEWIAENGKLKVTIDAGFITLSESCAYELTEDTLTLTNDEGESITYIRVAESE